MPLIRCSDIQIVTANKRGLSESTVGRAVPYHQSYLITRLPKGEHMLQNRLSKSGEINLDLNFDMLKLFEMRMSIVAHFHGSRLVEAEAQSM
jgi:hypothetical protein